MRLARLDKHTCQAPRPSLGEEGVPARSLHRENDNDNGGVVRLEAASSSPPTCAVAKVVWVLRWVGLGWEVLALGVEKRAARH